MKLGKHAAAFAGLITVFVASNALADASRIAEWTAGSETLKLQITGRTGPFATKIEVRVNGEIVATGATSVTKSVVNLSGEYRGMKIDAECRSVYVSGSVPYRECTIYVDSKQAAELKM